MKTIILILTILIAFSCCAPVESTEYYSAPQAQEEPVEQKNPIQLKKVYDHDEEEEGDDYSYVEMYRFDMKGMEYLHVQEDNGDGYGYVINLTKDSLMCAQLAREQPVGVSSASPASPISETNKEEDWYKN